MMLPLNNINNLRPYYECNDRFQREDERLKTFKNWPLDWLGTQVLATIGMFYTGKDDLTKCYFCEVIIGHWNPDDKPVQEHLRWSPNCSLLNRRITNNTPINAETLESILPKPALSICGIMEASYLNLMRSVDEASLSSITLVYPEYANETIRWRSFSKWPRYIKQTPQQLAEAGLFYTGISDHVKCFSCGLGLKDWEAVDIPWEQHALWMANCSFVKLTKGETFIKTVLDKFKTTLNQTKADVLVDQDTDHCEEWRKFNQESESLTTRNKLPSAADLVEEKLCKICFINDYDTAFLACGHVVSCAKCADSITQCPICRKPFDRVMRLYFT